MVMRKSLAIAVVFAISGMATACSTSPDEEPVVQNNDGQVLSNTETAPADLQLTCSTAAANQYGLAPDKVLPVSSSRLPDSNYQVRLAVDGLNFLCTIDNDANVISVVPA